MRKQLMVLFWLLSVFLSGWAQAVTLQSSEGWLESASVCWLPVEGAQSYRVYYSGEGKTDVRIDDCLVRRYDDYFRADVPGLKAGRYVLKVVPVISGVEQTGAVTDSLNVLPHDRSGFAFQGGRMPGAYQADGTPKPNAVILYITEKNKNTVSMEVTGATTNPCVGLQTILDGFKKGKDSRPLIVRLIGQISDASYLQGGDVLIENANNASGCITFEGVGDDAVADGWGLRIKNASNIEVRNIGFMNCNSSEGDNIGLQQANDHIWVHHCDLFYGDAGSDADQIKGDGALDCKKSTYITLSYNHFWDCGKCNLLGLSEGTTSGLFITYHHNWYDHSDSRHPRVRYYSAHVYNNYYDGNAKYGVGSTLGSSVFVEANYFRNCKYPILTSMQGTDVFDETKQANDYVDMPTFSKEDGGSIKAFNNYMTGQRRFVPYGAAGFPNPTADFDAYVVTSRNDTIPSTVVSSRGGNLYNNFDTKPSVMYAYTPDSPEAARDKVTTYSGRMKGGDFRWTFNNSIDDASYDVNAPLKAALTSYKTKLVSVQGDSAVVVDPVQPEDSTVTDTTTAIVHNFTISGKTSTFFGITGNLSDSKGTVTYSGLTLTQCLKIESATTISFTTTGTAVLTMVFNPTFTGRILINGTNYTATAGLITVTLPAASYQISKTDAANLYYLSLNYATAIPTVQPAENLSIFPNPAIDRVFLRSDSPVLKVALYASDGRLVCTKTADQQEICLDGLAPGVYLLRASTEKGFYNQKLIKK